jgi:hypothetical protein
VTERGHELEISAIRRWLAEVSAERDALKAHLKKLLQMGVSAPSVVPSGITAASATGRYLGEGFDDPPLDTLFLTMRISWKGILAQYVGRLHRNHLGKSKVVVNDYAEPGVPVLVPMAARRQVGYRSLDYTIEALGDGVSDRTLARSRPHALAPQRLHNLQGIALKVGTPKDSKGHLTSASTMKVASPER